MLCKVEGMKSFSRGFHPLLKRKRSFLVEDFKSLWLFFVKLRFAFKLSGFDQDYVSLILKDFTSVKKQEFNMLFFFSQNFFILCFTYKKATFYVHFYC